jgi:hypothetical protein
MVELIEEMKALAAELGNASGEIAMMTGRFETALAALEDATRWYLQNVAEDPDLGSAIGVDYMLLAGNVACAWLMGKAALAARKHIDAGSNDTFYPHKISTACFFAERILPRSEAQLQMVKSGSASVMAIEPDFF